MLLMGADCSHGGEEDKAADADGSNQQKSALVAQRMSARDPLRFLFRS